MLSDTDIRTYDQLAPSLYTATLIETLCSIDLPAGSACEIGVGSGVCLLCLVQRGYGQICGTDVNPESLAAARQLLERYAPEAQI